MPGKIAYAMFPLGTNLSLPITPGKLYEASEDDRLSDFVRITNDVGEDNKFPPDMILAFNKDMERVYPDEPWHVARRPFTQKARSIDACVHIMGCSPGLRALPGPYAVIPGTDDLEGMTFPVFARPCPTRPRHGFVDSRKVYDLVQVVKLLQSATAKDDAQNAEVVLMPTMTGRYSAVATNAGVTWGKSNDGVTAGTDASALNIPAFASSSAWLDAINEACGLRVNFLGLRPLIEDTPYVEVVEDDRYAHAVQLRDGPAQTGEVDYIPRKITVEMVLEPRRDLIEWERKVEEALGAFPQGLVIASKGMPLSSHYAVHGIERGIPVVTSRTPVVGETLHPTKGRPPRLTRSQCVSIRNETARLLEMKNPFGQRWEHWEEVVPTAIGTVHAQFQWGWKRHLLQLRAVALVALVKFTLAACVGEMRHWWSRHGPGMEESYDPDGGYCWEENGDEPEWFPYSYNSHSRNALYREMVCSPQPLAQMVTRLNALANSFEHSGWVRGYGGQKWGEVARAAAKLCVALDEFIKEPSVLNWRRAFDAANILVNTAHNGGKCLTKLTHENTMNAIARAPGIAFCNGFVGALLMGDLDDWSKRNG